MTEKKKQKRGFASIDPARLREIASMGGKASQASGKGHKYTSEEAKAAGSKGGKRAHELGTAHVFTSEEAREAGRKSGQLRGSNPTPRTNGEQDETPRTDGSGETGPG